MVFILKPCPDSEAKITLPSKNGKHDIILLSPFTSIVREIGSPKPLPLGNLFAGTEKDDPTQLHAIMMFPSMEVLQAFGADEELTEIRRKGGAVIETGVMTPISEDYFTNYPDAFIKH